MALSDSLRILITANGAQAEREFQQVGAAARTSLGQAESSAQRWGATLTSAGVAMTAFGAVALVGLGAAARAAEEEDLQIARLNNTIANSPALAGASADAFLDQAAALQDVTTFADDATIGVQSLLGQFGLTQDQILELTPLVLDLASKLGIGLQQAARAVGRATQGTAGGLSRMIGQFDVGSTSAQAFAGTVQALRTQVGGFAEVEGQTFSGQLQILQNNLGDIAEGIGRGALQAFNTLLGPIQALSDAFQGLSPQTQALIGSIGTFGAAGLTAAGALSFLVGQVILMGERFPILVAAVRGAAPELLAFAAAVAVATAAIALFGEDSITDIDISDVVAATNDELRTMAGLLSSTQSSDEIAQFFERIATEGGPQAVDTINRFAAAMIEIDPSNAALISEILVGLGDELGSSSAASALADLEEQTRRTQDAAQALDDTWAQLNNSLSRFDAANNAAQAVMSLGQAYRDAAADGNISAEETLNLNDSLSQVIHSFTAAAEAANTNANGVVNAAAANAQLQSQFAALRAFIPAELLPQFDRLTASIGRVPNHHETRVSAPGADNTVGEMTDVKDSAYKIPPSRNVAVTTSGIGAAIGALDAVTEAANRVGAAIGAAIGAQGNAEGGPVRAGEVGWVGERGPELFVPSTNGRIIPTYQLRRALQGGGAATAVVNNYYFVRGIDQAMETVPVAGRRDGERFLSGRK